MLLLALLCIASFLAYSAALPTEIRAATWPVPKTLVFLQWRYFKDLNINAATQSSGGIIKHLVFASHDYSAFLRIDNWEMIEGNKKNGKATPHPLLVHFLYLRIKAPCSVTSLLPLQTEPSATEQGSQSFPNVQKYLVELLKLIWYIKSCTAVECNKPHLFEVFSAILHFFGELGSHYSLI